jgi:hypothetical protein
MVEHRCGSVGLFLGIDSVFTSVKSGGDLQNNVPVHRCVMISLEDDSHGQICRRVSS